MAATLANCGTDSTVQWSPSGCHASLPSRIIFARTWGQLTYVQSYPDVFVLLVRFVRDRVRANDSERPIRSVKKNTVVTLMRCNVMMTNQKMVLVVDDDDDVRGFLTAALSTNGFAVKVARGGVEGIECYRRHRHELELVVSDILMPRMNGMDLALAIRALDTDMPILLISGYSDAQVEAESRKTFPFIRKPFRVDYMLAAVRSVMRPQ